MYHFIEFRSEEILDELILMEKVSDTKAEMDGLFIVKEEIPENKIDELLLKGGILIYPDSTTPIRQGILTLEASNHLFYENELDKPDKAMKEIYAQIIADIRKIEKIEGFQAFHDLMIRSSKKFIPNRRITTIFVFNGVDPSIYKSKIKTEIQQALTDRNKLLEKMDVFVIHFPYLNSAKAMNEVANEAIKEEKNAEIEAIKVEKTAEIEQIKVEKTAEIEAIKEENKEIKEENKEIKAALEKKEIETEEIKAVLEKKEMETEEIKEEKEEAIAYLKRKGMYQEYEEELKKKKKKKKF